MEEAQPTEPVMIHILRQRMLFIVTVFASAVCWSAVLPWLAAADGASGVSLATARIGFIPAILLVVVAGLAPVLLGAATSAFGGRLSGVMAVSLGLLIVAAQGGAIDGWIYSRGTAIPQAYLSLMMEMLVWQAGLVVLLVVIQKVRNPLTARWPALAYRDHLEVDLVVRWPGAATLAATGMCAVIGGVLGYWLVRDSDPGQVAGGLGASFLIAGLVTQMLMPRRAATGALFAPAVVALVVYGYVYYQFPDRASFLAAWYNIGHESATAASLPGPALALPIHYISAGVLGAAAGLAWARTISADSITQPVERDDAEADEVAQEA